MLSTYYYEFRLEVQGKRCGYLLVGLCRCENHLYGRNTEIRSLLDYSSERSSILIYGKASVTGVYD